ncbi:MAG: hypothetical protein N3G74_02025 [Candidatus Micrarchaeota archaeon]|nr:hypothetical protein [Candidatus Micrarchaeota archaeon]
MKKANRNAFIFTTDAFLALPLIVLAISTFIAFSVTLRDNITVQEYAYIIAKDAMNLLIDGSPSILGQVENDSFAYIISKKIAESDPNGANQTASVIDSIIPSNAAYILEYKTASSNQWTQIRVIDSSNKISQNKYSIQVSDTRLISEISRPRVNPSSNCPSEIVCPSSPVNQYTPGKIVGPLLIRIRVFI